jgi:glycosyltransferase involved in cell wall biosynthesis
MATRVILPPHSSLQEAALWSPRVLSELSALLAGIEADVEIWDTMRMGQYASALPRRRRVLYADDLFSLRYATMLDRIRTDRTRLSNPLGEFGRLLPGPARRLAGHPWVYRPLLQLERRRTAQSEERAPAQFDGTALVSAEEAAVLRQRTGSATVATLLPLIDVPAARLRQFGGRRTFVFLGGLDFPPNRDGLTWFLRHAREAVLAAMPDFELLVVGRGSDEAMPAEAAAWGDHVRPLGWVADLDDVLLTAAGLLSPLRMGSGTKIKVLEALARGLPVVATPHGVLGLGVGREQGCLVSPTPEGLAGLLAEAAGPAANAVLSAAATAAWIERFSPEVAGRAYDGLFGLPDHDRVWRPAPVPR